MKDALRKNISMVVLAVACLAATFYAGYQFGDQESYVPVSVTGMEGGESVDFTPFWKAWSELNQKFVTTSTTTSQVSDEDKLWGAIAGLADSYKDPYTVFFPPVESKIFESDISGTFEGVGMEIGVCEDVLTVIAPLKGTPAYNAGIKAGDKILAINGTTTAKMSSDEAIKLIRGPKGTTVTFTLLREGSADPTELKVVRDVIDIPTIETELRKDGVFRISLYSFSATSPRLFQDAMRKFLESNSHSLLLDLRGNPGGYLEAALDMASWFLPPGKVVLREDFGDKEDEKLYRSKGYDVFNKDKYKMVILVNGGSASASEILAGALREYGVATLVGEKTYGKGSVQELVKITPDTSLKITIAKWLTPNGVSISLNGLQPDVEVKLTQEDFNAGKDPQLDKAIELLLKK